MKYEVCYAWTHPWKNQIRLLVVCKKLNWSGYGQNFDKLYNPTFLLLSENAGTYTDTIHNPPTRVLYRSRHIITKEPFKGCKSLKVTIIRAILLIAEWREEARVLISPSPLYGSFRLSTAELSAVHIARCSLLTRAVKEPSANHGEGSY